MNWDAIGSIAELAGAIGVILSLIYLASQIRLNSKQFKKNSDFIESSIYQSVNDSALTWHAMMAKDPQVANIWKKIRIGQDLSNDESAQAHSIVSMLFILIEGQYKHYKAGVVTRDPFSANGIDKLLNTPYISYWLDKYASSVLTPEFVEGLVRVRHNSQSAED